MQKERKAEEQRMNFERKRSEEQRMLAERSVERAQEI